MALSRGCLRRVSSAVRPARGPSTQCLAWRHCTLVPQPTARDRGCRGLIAGVFTHNNGSLQGQCHPRGDAQHPHRVRAHCRVGVENHRSRLDKSVGKAPVRKTVGVNVRLAKTWSKRYSAIVARRRRVRPPSSRARSPAHRKRRRHLTGSGLGPELARPCTPRLPGRQARRLAARGRRNEPTRHPPSGTPEGVDAHRRLQEQVDE